MEEKSQMKQILSTLGLFYYLLLPCVVYTHLVEFLGWTYFFLLVTVPLIPSYLYLEYDWYPKLSREFMCRILMVLILVAMKYCWIG